jgi:branched-chain amino acid transport system permease protein
MLALLTLLAAYPITFPSFMTLGVTIVLFAAMATAWDVLGGWTGQLSLGHAVFVGIGAYSMGLLVLRANFAPWWGALVGAGASVAVAAMWGGVTFRLRGPYFALASIAIAEVIRIVANNWAWLTGGAEGLSLPSLPLFLGLDLFSRPVEFYLALALLGLTLLVAWRLQWTRFGYYLQAIRENEDAAMALGINPTRYKVRAFLVSALLTSLAGSLYGLILGFFEPRGMFSLDLSVQLALMAYIGGAGTLFGPLVGAGLLVGGSEILRIYFPGKSLFVYGVLIILVVLFAPGGLGTIRQRWHRG